MTPELRAQSLEERWIVGRIDETRAELEELLPRFDFAHAVDALYHLTFDDFCDWYAEAIKPRLYADDASAVSTALAALERLLALLHPVMPHVTEEIWAQFHESRLIVSPWPLAGPVDQQAAGDDEPRAGRSSDLPPQRRPRRPRREPRSGSSTPWSSPSEWS